MPQWIDARAHHLGWQRKLWILHARATLCVIRESRPERSER